MPANPHPPTLKRLSSALLEVTATPSKIAGCADLSFYFLIPAVDFELRGQVSMGLVEPPSDSPTPFPPDEAIVAAAFTAVRVALKSQLCSDAPPPQEPPSDSVGHLQAKLHNLSEEHEALKAKYDALLCSRMGVLHDEL